MPKVFRKHQIQAFRYTLRERHPALFIEMRLGKCLVTIRRCKLYTPRDGTTGLKVLIVAPAAALGSWESELTSEGEEFITLDGTTTQKLFKLDCDYRWYLTNKESHLTIGAELCNRWQWDAVIVDESTSIKNMKARITGFYLRNFRSVPHRWILTGMPNPEDDIEYFTQLQFLDGRAFGFGNVYAFRAKMYEPDPSPGAHAWVPKFGTEKKIRDYVGGRACIISRKDAGVEPTKEYVERIITMPKEKRLEYDRCERDFELPDGTTTIWATTKYIWLRKMCGALQEKIDALLELLTGELKDSQVVVWFNYNDEIEYVIAGLLWAKISHCHLWGKQSREQREELRQCFQTGDFRVVLVQQAVAQMGMDLSAADTAIYYSEPHGTLASVQTEDRIVNLSKPTPLLYIYLLIKNSVETDLRSALVSKRFNSSSSLSEALAAGIRNRSNGFR